MRNNSPREFFQSDAARPSHGKGTTNCQDITEALVAAGFQSLDAQAKALGLHRSTAWTIIRARHKLGRLSAKTTKRILANPELPQTVRLIVERYVTERSNGIS